MNPVSQLRLPEISEANQQTERSEDRELERRLTAALAAHGLPSLREVFVAAEEGNVCLRGRVYTFYAQQIAYHITTGLSGGRPVVDEIDVIPPRELRPPGSAWRELARLALPLFLFALLATGCSQAEPERIAVHPVQGQVTFNGKPAAGAFVVFHPQDASTGLAPSAKVDALGNYSLTTYEAKDGAPAGQYVVTVVLQRMVNKNGEYVPGPNLLPPQASKPATSKILARVAQGPNHVPTALKR